MNVEPKRSQRMVIKEKIGNINFFAINNRKIDSLLLEWYETNKRILRRKTNSGKELSLKFMNENPGLMQGDILYNPDLQDLVSFYDTLFLI